VQHIVVEREAVDNLLRHHGLLIDLTLEGGTKEVAKIQEIQRDAFGDRVMHLDFVRIDVTKPIRVEVPLIFKGTPKGVAKQGHLRVALHSLGVEALIKDIPEDIVVKVDDLDLDQVMRVKELKLPDNVKATRDPEDVVAAVRLAIIEAEP